jgi:uncharacterized protein YegP (UPF0339 family)
MRPHRIQYWITNGKYRWRVRAGNHVIIAASTQGYRTRFYALRKAKQSLPSGADYTLERIDQP